MGTEFSVLFVSLVHSCAKPQSTPLRLHLLFFLKHPGGPNSNYTLVSYFSGCDRHLEEHLKGGDIYLAPSFREC